MKIRTDFVTNSSSTSYCIIIEKLSPDEEILKELEKLSGWGPQGAKEILGMFSKADDYEFEHLPNEKGEKLFSTQVTTSDTEDTDWCLNVANALTHQVFSAKSSVKKPKSFRIVEIGNEE